MARGLGDVYKRQEFAADPALMGSYAQVHLTGARATVLLGELET